MSEPLFVQLARLETQFVQKRIANADYLRSKWHILLQMQENKETAVPVTRDRRKKTITDSLGADFCYVTPSIFICGPDNEFRQIRTSIYIAKHPVTVREFRTFVTESGWDYPSEDLDAMSRISADPECPATHISWLDAKEYCRWLRRKTNEYYSLPYELEWEYAARGFDGRPYPWGYQTPDSNLICCAGDVVFHGTVPVGTNKKNRSPFGCMGMVGNVWEFCVDDFDDPVEPHVLRGGSWCHDADVATCTSRIFCYPPDKRADYAGFRVVYLPGDMLTAYQSQSDSDAEEDSPGLQVLSHLPGHEPAAEKPRPSRAKETSAAPKPAGGLKKIAKVLPADADDKKRRKS